MPFSFNPEQKQTVLWLAVGLALALLLVKLGPVLAPFLAAAILAYALNPAVDWLCARRLGRIALPRALAVTLVMLAFFASIVALFLIVTPVLQKQAPLLQEQIPELLGRMNAWLGPRLRDIGVHIRLDETGVRRIVSKYVATSGDELWSMVLASARVGGVALIGWLVMLALVPIALFYLLLDWHGVLARITNLVPRRWVANLVNLAREVDSLLAQYLRGQLSVIVVLCVYYASTLALAGVDVAVPVGVLTGLLIFIPYIGFGIGFVLALVSAMLQFNDLHGLAAVAGIYGVGQVIEGFILTPRLVGERIGLHPLTVIFALFAFGQLFGFVGVLLALPASAVLAVAVKHMRMHYINSSFYRQS
ncbi:AI-2E family transporter [Noviherbaspirillum galbum]|uniref:AI-2E family transporter n=1 Tax=Noviherbaspirillum galbum TaxID=2709383 RepID=A0A6B3SPQ9_9BURK|nr:AI-2E family transporter [Noviherbaspirillum galbum]NEX60706.1 AI-2E family transporter [Noviherbaspirillum galbum]